MAPLINRIPILLYVSGIGICVLPGEEHIDVYFIMHTTSFCVYA